MSQDSHCQSTTPSGVIILSDHSSDDQPTTAKEAEQQLWLISKTRQSIGETKIMPPLPPSLLLEGTRGEGGKASQGTTTTGSVDFDLSSQSNRARVILSDRTRDIIRDLSSHNRKEQSSNSMKKTPKRDAYHNNLLPLKEGSNVDSFVQRELDIDSSSVPTAARPLSAVTTARAEKEEDFQPKKPTTTYQSEEMVIPDRNQTSSLVSLPREEFEALIDRVKALENTIKQNDKAVEDTKVNNNNLKRMEALEGMMKKLLLGRNHCAGSPQPEKTELTQQPDIEGQQNRKEEDQSLQEEEWHSPFGETIYTLFYICPFESQGFWYSFLVYCLQIATISLALADSVDFQAENNPLHLPAMVDPTVTWAQGITVFILFAYQSDLIEAVLKLGDGFYPIEGHPGTTFSTWLFSCLAQLLVGLLVLLGCFILTMQAETVIDLMLNLTALLFISEMDDLGFNMAKMGFVTSALEIETNSLEDIQIPKKKTRNSNRRYLYFLTLFSLFGGYGILKHRQLHGYYLFTNIYVQFGDAYNPKLPYYSGILTATQLRNSAHREYRDMGTSTVLLAYCTAERAWTFSEGSADPCNDYFAKSYETTTYDVTSIPDSEWQVIDRNGRLQPFDSFSLVERDCHSDTCQGVCDTNGLCQCSNHQFGLDCEFSDVCEEIVFDEEFPSFPQVLGPSFVDPSMLESKTVSKKFQRLKNEITNEYLHVYSMPVYYSNSTFPAFGGRRWILTTEQQLVNLTEAKQKDPNRWFFPEKSIAALTNDFHAHHEASYTPYFISDPVDFETPGFQPTPIGVHWWTVKNTNETLRHFEPDAEVEPRVHLICHESAASRGPSK